MPYYIVSSLKCPFLLQDSTPANALTKRSLSADLLFSSLNKVHIYPLSFV